MLGKSLKIPARLLYTVLIVNVALIPVLHNVKVLNYECTHDRLK